MSKRNPTQLPFVEMEDLRDLLKIGSGGHGRGAWQPKSADELAGFIGAVNELAVSGELLLQATECECAKLAGPATVEFDMGGNLFVRRLVEVPEWIGPKQILISQDMWTVYLMCHLMNYERSDVDGDTLAWERLYEQPTPVRMPRWDGATGALSYDPPTRKVWMRYHPFREHESTVGYLTHDDTGAAAKRQWIMHARRLLVENLTDIRDAWIEKHPDDVSDIPRPVGNRGVMRFPRHVIAHDGGGTIHEWDPTKVDPNSRFGRKLRHFRNSM